MALKLGIQTYQILINDDEVCIPSLSSILLAVLTISQPERADYAHHIEFVSPKISCDYGPDIYCEH